MFHDSAPRPASADANASTIPAEPTAAFTDAKRSDRENEPGRDAQPRTEQSA
jgi:hypothetical protein